MLGLHVVCFNYTVVQCCYLLAVEGRFWLLCAAAPPIPPFCKMLTLEKGLVWSQQKERYPWRKFIWNVIALVSTQRLRNALNCFLSYQRRRERMATPRARKAVMSPPEGVVFAAILCWPGLIELWHPCWHPNTFNTLHVPMKMKKRQNKISINVLLYHPFLNSKTLYLF